MIDQGWRKNATKEQEREKIIAGKPKPLIVI